VGQRTHKQAMLPMRGRRMLAELVLCQGWPIARAAERLCVSRPTARKWVRRFEAEGEAGLEDRPATARRRPHRLSPARERAILDRRDATLAGPHPIGWTLGENSATVHRVLARHARPRLWELDVAAQQVVRYERDQPRRAGSCRRQETGPHPPRRRVARSRPRAGRAAAAPASAPSAGPAGL
jgi:transposase